MGRYVAVFLLSSLFAVLSAGDRRIPDPHFFYQVPPPPVPIERAEPVQAWYEQKLTHFDPDLTTTWYQQVWTNREVYQTGGPIFIMLGGEGPAGPGWLQAGHMYDMAKDHGAMLMLIEHRYYGNSKPTADVTTESLRYLSPEEALADAAQYLTDFKAQNTEFQNSLIIVFGGSYPANLASWFRLLYPDLIHGAVASSAPVLLELDFKEYLEVVNDALEAEWPGCASAIREATTNMNNLLSAANGPAELTNTFHLCETLDVNNPLDVSNFFSTMANAFSGAVQYNGTNDSIGNLCYYMTDESYGTPMERLAYVAGGSSQQCVEVTYKSFVDYYATDRTWEGPGASSSYLQWFYQTCSRFGYYQTGASQNQPFGGNFQVDFNIQQCMDFYGGGYNQINLENRIAEGNQEFQGLNPSSTNVVFVHGTTDPWHALGITKDISADVHGILIQGTSHCYDMYSDTPGDLPQLTVARQQIREYVSQWLS